MGNLDVCSLFTNIPLEEITDICTNTLFENIERVEGLSKIEFKKFFFSFLFNGKLYKHVDVVAICSP